MENATKALLIAAAVLVAIIIISLGVYVVSLAQNQMKGAESGLNDVEIQSHINHMREHLYLELK